MNVSRRNWIVGAGAVPLQSAAVSQLAAAPAPPQLPAKAEFPVVSSEVCLNNARWHPISRGALRTVQEYLDYKAGGGGNAPEYANRIQNKAKSLFAQLVNAKLAEISFVPSTVVGENLVVSGLGLPSIGGNVVTDALHFEGSLYLYGELAKQGLDVRIVRPRDWRIDLRDLERVVDRNTKLVALSLVSMINGFQHDLKAVCDLAHAHGAHVYADLAQAAGAVPIDMRTNGLDFGACASYKWLMGDMGLGFLYVRESLMDRVIRRSQFGQRQLANYEYHLFPYDPPGNTVMEWTQSADAGGHFEIGTVSNTTVACLTYSLKYLQDLGVEKIQSYRRPLIERLQKELPRLGFQSMTPPESTSPIVTFARQDVEGTKARLRQARVDISVYKNRIRISPSVYNDQGDVDRLLECLA